MIIKGESKNRGHWKLRYGKENVTRAVGLRTVKTYLERPMQLLYLMELHCNTVRNTEKKLNTSRKEFRPSRPKRTTVAVAKVKIQGIQQEGDDI